MVTRGPDGKNMRSKTKEYYYVCDLAPPVEGGMGGGRLRQSSLSNFWKTTPKRSLNDNDTNGVVGTAGLQQHFSLSTSTVGQHLDSDEQHENFVIDENER